MNLFNKSRLHEDEIFFTSKWICSIKVVNRWKDVLNIEYLLGADAAITHLAQSVCLGWRIHRDNDEL